MVFFFQKKDITSARIKPNILDKDRERTLSKIATRGVVQLFNAVRIQQKDLAFKLKEAPLERKRDKILKSIDKRSFLNVLMGTSKSEEVDAPVKEDKEEKVEGKDPTWDVLKDDFMMGAKMKDWDRNVTDDELSDEPMEDQSSDESS